MLEDKKQSEVVFKRKSGTIAGLLECYKNNFVFSSRIKLTSLLTSLLVILLLLLTWLAVVTFPMSLYLLLSLVILQLLSFYFIRKTSPIFKLKTIVLKDDNLLVSYKKSLEDKILYKNILRLSLAGYYTFAATHTFTSVGAIISVLRLHFQLEYRNAEGERKKILIPLDLVNLQQLLKVIIEKAELTKIKPNEISLLLEWRKLIPEKASKIPETNNLSLWVISPNLNLGRTPFIIGTAIIVFVGLMLWNMTTTRRDHREIASDSRRKVDIQEILFAQKKYFRDNNQYYQSIDYPSIIPGALTRMPNDPKTHNHYGWIDNTGDNQKFCVYTDLENDNFYIANQKGLREIEMEPYTLYDCERFP